MWTMIALAVRGSPSDQTGSVNPRAPDIQEITVREMISVIVTYIVGPDNGLSPNHRQAII